MHLWTAVRTTSKALRAVMQKLPHELLVGMSQRMTHQVAAAAQVVLMTATVMTVMQMLMPVCRRLQVLDISLVTVFVQAVSL